MKQLIAVLAVLSCLVKNIATGDQDDFYLCLHNCALCVRQWEEGAYNGEKCAKQCTTLRTSPRIVDPDCVSLKMFNYNVMDRVSDPNDEKSENR